MWARAAFLAGLMTWLLMRLWPDVGDKPLHEDEAVAGLISARPFGDMLHTVLLDRGGAPLHFMLAHLTFEVDASAEALRWLSVVFALATVPLCYDLARRLAGFVAGLTAAALAATAQLLTVYGSFGRMYALFAFVGALAVDSFLRAVDHPSRRSSLVATAAALLPVGVHPFGVFLFAAEALVAAAVWRGRDLARAVPVVLVGLLAVPLLVVDLRLSDRYAAETGQDLTGGFSAGGAFVHALGGSAGGTSVLLVVFAALAAVGLLALTRRSHAFAALACLTLAVPPAALAVGGGLELTADRLSPRHLIFVLPLWVALVSIGATHIARMLPGYAAAALPFAVAVAAALAPAAISDPRTLAAGRHGALDEPARWVRANVAGGDLLYPFSPLFLASLPEAGNARGYPREAVALERALARTNRSSSIFVAIPRLDDDGTVDASPTDGRGDVRTFESWFVLLAPGPFTDGDEALRAAAEMLEAARAGLRNSPKTRAYVEQLRGTACLALEARC